MVKKGDKKMTENKKSQLKIQQTAFMLLALVVLFSIVIIFYFNFTRTSRVNEANDLMTQEAYSLLQKFSGNPEFSCVDSSGMVYCLDEDKLVALSNMSSKYKDYFSGIASLQVREIYPSNKTIIIYNSPANSATEEVLMYSAFIPLCKLQVFEGYNWQQCKLAKFIVGKVKLKLK
jgi:hypothetical protein